VGAGSRPVGAGDRRRASETLTQVEGARWRMEREAAEAQHRAERRAEAAQRWAQKQAEAEARRRSREYETTVRTVGRIATSRTGQSVIRSIFGTLFGGPKR